MKWEYISYFIPENKEKSIIDFKDLGNEGWKLVTVDSGIAYFERFKDVAIRELSNDDEVGIRKAIGDYFGGEVAKFAKPIEIDGDYLIISPKLGGIGNHQMLTERDFLEENIQNFLSRHPELSLENVTVYELKKVEID